MSAKKAIVITGANRGLGLGLAETLIKSDAPYNLILTTRKPEYEEQILRRLYHLNPLFDGEIDIRTLEVTSKDSIESFFGGLGKKVDVLVNNAGVWIKRMDYEAAQQTFETNLYGPINLMHRSLSEMNDGGKIINLSSTLTGWKLFNKKEVKLQVMREDITMDEIIRLSKEYLEIFKNGKIEEAGWNGNSFFEGNPYGPSKLFLTLYTKDFSRQPDVLSRNIQVYSACPGWIRSEMGGDQAPLSVDQGTETPMHLINLPFQVEKAIQGMLFSKCKLVPLSRL